VEFGTSEVLDMMIVEDLESYISVVWVYEDKS